MVTWNKKRKPDDTSNIASINDDTGAADVDLDRMILIQFANPVRGVCVRGGFREQIARRWTMQAETMPLCVRFLDSNVLSKEECIE